MRSGDTPEPPGTSEPAPARLLSPGDIRGLLAAHGIRPSRALGQNFLADPNTARRIVRLAGVGARRPGARGRARASGR